MGLTERVHNAAIAFLQRQNYKIINPDFSGFVVCRPGDGEPLVFVFMEVCEHEFTEQGKYSPAFRRECENIAFNYINANEMEPQSIRFDVVSMRIADNGKQAFLRHHVNALFLGLEV